MESPRSHIPSEVSINLCESVQLNDKKEESSLNKQEWPDAGALPSVSSRSLHPSQSRHSDDEVASRRGLETAMSEEKLKLLQAEFADVKASAAPVNDTDLLSDLNEQALNNSIITSAINKPMITPRLFNKNVDKSSSRHEASESACNMGSSSEESFKGGRYNQAQSAADESRTPNPAM